MTSSVPDEVQQGGTTWVRIGAGRVAHILGSYGTAARSTSKCGKTGKITLIPEVGGRPVCDACRKIRRSG